MNATTTCTQEQAEEWLRRDLEDAEESVDSLVTVHLNQNQYDALCSFVYNCGGKALADSTLLSKLNQGDFAGAAKEFTRWNKSRGRVLTGLTKRRQEEAALFIEPIERLSQ